jgi:Ribosomal protein L7/L12 C-terminal domain
MLGLGAPELLILLVILAVIVVMVRVSGREKKPRDKPSPGRALSTPVPAELQSQIRTLAAADQRIQAIKLLREATGLGLLDAKNAVDAIAAGRALPTPDAPPRAELPRADLPRADLPRADLAYRARSLVSAGRGDEAVRLVATETGMSAPEADAFVRSLLP